MVQLGRLPGRFVGPVPLIKSGLKTLVKMVRDTVRFCLLMMQNNQTYWKIQGKNLGKKIEKNDKTN